MDIIPPPEEYLRKQTLDMESELQYESLDNNITDQLLGVSILGLILTFYYKNKNKKPDFLLANLDKELDKLEKQLLKNYDKGLQDLYFHEKEKLLKPYGILKPGTYKNISFQKDILKEITELNRDSIESAIIELKEELKIKIKYHNYNGFDPKTLDISSPVKETGKKIRNMVRFNHRRIQQKINRETVKFVHGDNILTFWVSAHNPTTCGWCLYMESLPPRLVDEWPMDHPNGNCRVKPVDNNYTNRYLKLLEEQPVTLISKLK